jgi:hypothetical protein
VIQTCVFLFVFLFWYNSNVPQMLRRWWIVSSCCRGSGFSVVWLWGHASFMNGIGALLIEVILCRFRFGWCWCYVWFAIGLMAVLFVSACFFSCV